MLDKKIISTCLGQARAFYQGYDLKKETIELWYDLFKNEDSKIFNVAFKHTLKTSEFFPTPAIVQKNILKVKKALKEREKGIKTAQTEWEAIMTFARRGQKVRAHEYAEKHYPTMMALRAVTFTEICYCDTVETLPWRKKEFIEVWDYHSEKQHTNKQILITHDEASKQLTAIQANIEKTILLNGVKNES